MRRRTMILTGCIAVAVVGAAVAGWLQRPAGQPTSGSPTLAPLGPEAWAGATWIETSADVANGPAWASVYGASRVGDELVAWGFARPRPSQPQGTDGPAAVWRSSDGLAWHEREVRLDGEAGFAPTGIAFGPLGLLAAGYSTGDKGTILAGSADAVTWTAMARPAATFDVQFLAATDRDYLATGYLDGRPTSWLTTDARAWTEVPLPERHDGLQLNDLVSSQQGTHLAGSVSTPSSLRPVLWRLDGETWLPIELPRHEAADRSWAAGVHDLVPFHGGVFALGRAGLVEDCGTTSARMASVHPAPVRTAETTTGDMCPWPPPAAWVSPDGTTWREAALPVIEGVDPNEAIHSVTAGGPGLIALVFEGVNADIPRFGLWTSADGISWTRIGDGPPLRRGNFYMQFLAMAGRVVVLGDDGNGTSRAWVGIATR